MSKWMFAAGFAVAFGFVAGQAMATETNGVETRQVSIANVDFRSEASVNAFYTDLRHAAQAVCNTNSANPRIQQLDRACYNRAMGQAVSKVNRPVLTALFQAKGGASTTAFAQGY